MKLCCVCRIERTRRAQIIREAPEPEHDDSITLRNSYSSYLELEASIVVAYLEHGMDGRVQRELMRQLGGTGSTTKLDLDYTNHSSIMQSACLHNHVDCIRNLLDSGADIETNCDDGWSPLHIVCFHGYYECAKLLLERGACIESKTRDTEETALHLACDFGHLNCAKVLLRHSAPLDVLDNEGNTPLQVIPSQFPAVIELLRKWKKNM